MPQYLGRIGLCEADVSIDLFTDETGSCRGQSHHVLPACLKVGLDVDEWSVSLDVRSLRESENWSAVKRSVDLEGLAKLKKKPDLEAFSSLLRWCLWVTC